MGFLAASVKLAQAYSTNEVSEAGVVADWVEIGMRFEELKDIRLLLVGLLEPVEGLFVIAQTKVGVHKRTRRNIPCLRTSFQFRQ